MTTMNQGEVCDNTCHCEVMDREDAQHFKMLELKHR